MTPAAHYCVASIFAGIDVRQNACWLAGWLTGAYGMSREAALPHVDAVVTVAAMMQIGQAHRARQALQTMRERP